MARALETDLLSNQDIHAALAIGAYTAAATRLVYVRVLADSVAGNDDYTFYVTLQVGGSGSHHKFIPITEAAAASGDTAIGAVSIAIPVDSGDVLTVYIVGAAGDTTDPDTKVGFYEHDYLIPTTADRKLDVSSTGEAGVDWANVGTPGSTVNLSATTVKTLTDDVTVATASKTGYALSAAGVDAILDEVVEGTYTMRQMLKVMAAALVGKVSGGGTTTIVFKGVDGSTSRVTATVDANGNRSSVTLDGA